MNIYKSKIPIYYIHSTNDKSKGYTYVASKEQVLEYVCTLVTMNHSQHFKSWCENNNVKLEDDSLPVMKKYAYTVWPEEVDKISYSKLYYSISQIAYIMRYVDNAIPLGCSYEEPSEFTSFMEENSELISEYSNSDNTKST